MQVAAAPLLQSGDILQLNEGFNLHHHELHDQTVGSRHQLHGLGVALVRMLEQPITYGKVLDVARQHGLADEAVNTLLGCLNHMGALQRRRRIHLQLAALLYIARSWALGVRFAPLAWRRPANICNLLTGCMRATLPVTAASMVSVLVLLAAGMGSSGYLLGGYAYALVLFVSSVMAHEYTHLAIIRRIVPGVAVVHCGLRLGLVHRPVLPASEWHSALAGPIAGVVSCLAAAFLCWSLHLPILAVVAGLIGAFHISSLLPGYGDGHTIWRLLIRNNHA